MRQLQTLVLAFALLSCGGGNSPVTPGGRTLQPVSAEMMQYLGLPFVVVTDIPDYCGRLRAAFPEPKGCNVTVESSATTNPFGAIAGSMLSIGAYGASDGAKLDIIRPDGGFFGITTGAMVTVMTVGPNAINTFQTTAIEGSVNISSFRTTSSISGSYDVTFDNGERKSGGFSAKYCDAYEKIFANIGNTRTCS